MGTTPSNRGIPDDDPAGSGHDDFVELFGGEAAVALFRWQKMKHCQLLPMQVLSGGFSGAPVVVVIERRARGPLRKLVLKLCSSDDSTEGAVEPERHDKAFHYNSNFADDHLVAMVHDPLPVDTDTPSWITFYALAGVGLDSTPPTSVLLQGLTEPGTPAVVPADKLADLLGRVVRSVLGDWLVSPEVEQVAVVDFLQVLLDGRHRPGRSAHQAAADHWPELLDPGVRSVTVDGVVCPNPFLLATEPGLTAPRGLLWALLGPSHGDLHPGNLLVPIREVSRGSFKVQPLSTYWLIDLSGFSEKAPLVADPVHLLLSVASLALGVLTPRQQDALLLYIVHPDDARSRDRLPGWLQQTVSAIVDARADWIEESWFGEWQEQARLALVAWGLRFAGRGTTADAHRRWYLQLAALAGRAFLEGEAPTSTLPPRGPVADPSAVDPGPPPPAGPARRVTVSAGTDASLLPTSQPRRQLDRDLVQAGDELAGLVQEQWRRAAEGRRLVDPAPVPVRWVRVAQPSGLDPAPWESVLRRGELVDLFPLYYSLRTGSGRLLVTGRAGAGKSAAVLLLALDVLEYRAHREDDADRAAMAVPVVLTPHDWDPQEQALVDWMAQRIASDYPLLGSRRRARWAAEQLIRDKRIALFLDGLDEMPPDARTAALGQLQAAAFTVVVVSRRADGVAGTSSSSVIAVELQPVDHRIAAAYLARCVEAPPPGWWELVAHLRDHPGSLLARGLDSPLTLGLLRDTYGAPAAGVGAAAPDVQALLAKAFSDPGAVERHLLEQVLRVAYASPPAGGGTADVPSWYSPEEAERWLSSFANLMEEGDTADLAWWRLPGSVPWWPVLVVSGVLAGLPPALLFGVVGLFGGHTAEGVLCGVLIGPLAAAFDVLTAAYGRRWHRTPWGGVALGYGLIAVVAGSLSGVLLRGFPEGLSVGAVGGVGVGLVAGTAAGWEAARHLGSRGRPSVGANDGEVSPEEGWREDARQARRFGGLMGATVAVTVALVLGLAGAPPVAVGAAAIVAAVLMPFAVLMLSPRKKTTLAAILLARRGRSPVQIVQFLEEARYRNVLQEVGSVYQFRHARLQDLLAQSWSGAAAAPRRSWLHLLRTSLRPWGRVRVSFAALLRVKEDGRYVLVGGPVRPGCYGPPGGVFKHRADGSRPLDAVGFQEDRSPSHHETMRFDLRGYVPARSLRAFVRWFAAGRGRESAAECLRRELDEKFGDLPVGEATDIGRLRFDPVRTVVEGPHRVPGRPYRQMRRIEVYDLDRSDPASARFLTRLFGLAADPGIDDVVVATAAEIESGWRGEHQVAPQSAYLIGHRKLWPDVPPMP